MLPAFCINFIVAIINQIRHFHQFKALFFQSLDQAVKSFGSILGTVVTEDNGTVSQMFMIEYSIQNGVCAVILPIQTVYIPLYRMISAAFHRFYQGVVVISIWWSECEKTIMRPIPNLWDILKNILLLLILVICDILSAWEAIEPRRLPSIFGGTDPPDQRGRRGCQ